MIKCEGVDGSKMFFGKLAVIAFVFIVLNLWTGLASWVQATNVWWFVGAFVILVLLIGGGSCPVNAAVAKKTTKKKKK
ncbi:hypothetical protein HN935_01255 [archaeon]|jgi:hypothetical protein|nr:hypothetical protein [archaeon]